VRGEMKQIEKDRIKKEERARKEGLGI